MKTQKSKVARNEWVRQQRFAGRSMRAIANELGLTENAVHHICQKVGCSGVMVPEETARQNSAAAARLTGEKLRKTPEILNKELEPFGFEYVSGYTGCDSKVTLRCMKCRQEVELNYNFTRKPRQSYKICPECRRLERERRQATEQWTRDHELQLQKISKARQLEMRFGICAECGQPFVVRHGNQVCCSTACSTRRTNHRKDRRLNSQNIIDKDITLERLYKRDSGVCYLCGKVCDWTDFAVKDGATICGDDYPSIEHVEPLSRGGKHSWQNVRLACRRCNTAKNDTPLVVFTSAT